jgi:hypothetical protein
MLNFPRSRISGETPVTLATGGSRKPDADLPESTKMTLLCHSQIAA